MYKCSLWSRFSDGRLYALDCRKDLDVHVTFLVNVTKMSRERRRAGAKDFFITGDFNVELGLLCPHEDDFDELNEMHGPYVGKDGKRPGRIQEADAVCYYEGVQLQGHLHVVQMQPREGNSLSRTSNSATRGKK